MLLFTDEHGGLCPLDVTYSQYSGPFPEGLLPGAIIGAWPAARKWVVTEDATVRLLPASSRRSALCPGSFHFVPASGDVTD